MPIHTAAGLGLITSLGALGGFVAPNLRMWAEHTWGTPQAGLYAVGAVTGLNIALIFCLPYLGLDAGRGNQATAIEGQPASPADNAQLLRPARP